MAATKGRRYASLSGTLRHCRGSGKEGKIHVGVEKRLGRGGFSLRRTEGLPHRKFSAITSYQIICDELSFQGETLESFF